MGPNHKAGITGKKHKEHQQPNKEDILRRQTQALIKKEKG